MIPFLKILIFDQLKYWLGTPCDNARCISSCGLASDQAPHGHVGCFASEANLPWAVHFLKQSNA